MSAIREAILKAVVGCEHIIGVDKVELFYDDERPGKTALTQLADRIEAAISQQAPVSAEVGVWQIEPLERIMDEYVSGYTFEGDEGYHQPSEGEQAMIKDAIMGLVAYPDWDEAWGRQIERVIQSRAQVVPAEPVAIVGSGYSLLWASPDSLAAIVRRTGLKIGDALYLAAPAVSEPHLDLCASQDDTMSNYPKCDCGAKPHEPAEAADKAWRKWSLAPVGDAWAATPEFKRLEAAFRAGFASAAPAEPTPIAPINMEQAFERHFGFSMQRARNSFERAGVVKYWEAGWDARGDAASEAEVLRADAERYRWLRSIDSFSEWNRVGHYAADALDRQVDSAIAASKPASAKGGES